MVKEGNFKQALTDHQLRQVGHIDEITLQRSQWAK